MKTQARDFLVLIDASRAPQKAVESLTFVPPLRVQHLTALPPPETITEEPLVYLLGQTDDGRTSHDLLDWLDRLRAAEGAPVAFLLPREGHAWCPATTHPQFCGLLPWQPEIRIEAMERILHESRQNLARRWGRGTVHRASFFWSFSSREAADPEQSWLLLESALAELIGSSSDMSCLGMAFAEVLTNAVEHGNLELESSLKDGTNDGLLRFFEERERRLGQARYGQRRIRVAVELRGSRLRVRVRNEGRGFDPRCLTSSDSERFPQSDAHGLGLTMVESLVDEIRISRDGRTVTLTHSLPREQARARGAVPILFEGEKLQRRAA